MNGAKAIVFVVDSNDQKRFSDARQFLHSICGEPALYGCPVLVMAHKQDLPSATSSTHIAEALDVASIVNHAVHVMSTACTGQRSALPGLDWCVYYRHCRRPCSHVLGRIRGELRRNRKRRKLLSFTSSVSGDGQFGRTELMQVSKSQPQKGMKS
jgi:hypothetical protein